MAGNQEVTDLPVIPAVDGADVYGAKNNLDYRIRTGEPGGLATLDGSGQLPAAQFPPIDIGDVTGLTAALDAKVDVAGDTMTGPLNGTSATFTGLLTGNGVRSSNGVITGAGTTAIYANDSAGTIFLRPNGSGSATGQLAVNASFFSYDGNTVWHSGNDGAGSGLDADLLDGLSGADYARLGTTNTFTQINRFNTHVGIGTDPTSVPGIGNPVFGANNIILYNVGDLNQVFYSDSAAPRTHRLGFGAAGISTFDAGFVWTTSTRDLAIYSVGLPRLTVGANGNITLSGSIVVSGQQVAGAGSLLFRPNGIGNTTGQATIGSDGRFTVTGTFATAQNVESSGVNLVLGTTGAGTVFLRPNGVGSGTAQATYSSAGNLTIAGTGTGVDWVATSDATLKTNIRDRQARERLPDMLRFVEWLWKDSGNEGLGLIAQEVQKAAPEYVHEGADGKLAIDKASLALECVIGLAARVRELEEKI